MRDIAWELLQNEPNLKREYLLFHFRSARNTVLFLFVSAVTIVNYGQTTTSTQTNEPPAAVVDGQQAVYLAGLANIKPGAKGFLNLTSSAVQFESDNIHASVPVNQITAVFKGDEHAEKGGTAGSLLRHLPYGGGMAMGAALQKKVDLLSFEYLDAFGGYHGAVFVLPQDQAAALKERVSAQIVPHAPPQAVSCSADQGKPNSIEFDSIDAKDIDVPAEYRLLLYEHLLTELQRRLPTYKFYRAGDIATGPGCMSFSLHITITGFTKGNESLRASTGPIGLFAGVTSLSFQLGLKNSSGALVFDKNLKQNQRGDKESLNLTQSIAKNIAKRINKTINQNAKKSVA
jgi:hypothetical protein